MNRTKDQIIDAFVELLEEMPYSKITVRNIVDKCGVNRNTFYYHFQDIPSLLEELLRSNIDLLIQEHCHLGSLEDCISVTVQYFLKKRTAVLHVYKSLPREVFLTHLDRLLFYLAEEYIDTISTGMELSEDDRALIVRYFKCILVGVMLDWLDSGMSYDILSDSLRIYELRGDSGFQMLQNAEAPRRSI